MDKLESEAETELERKREINKNIIHHTPAADTPGAVLSLTASSRLWEEVSIDFF